MKLSQITEISSAAEKYRPQIELVLDIARSRVKNAFSRDFLEIERELLVHERKSSIEYEAQIRFSTSGSVWKSREEDDDHPVAIKKAFKEIDKILQTEVKRLPKLIKLKIDRTSKWPQPPAKNKVRAVVGGEEKGWVTLSIELGL